MDDKKYKAYRSSLAKQLRTERAKDFKDYDKEREKIEKESDVFIQTLKSNTKPNDMSDDTRQEYINATIKLINEIKSEKLKAITHKLTQQDRIFMILKYHQDHDPYYTSAKKLSRTKREIKKKEKDISKMRSQLKTLDTTINEQQEKLNEINARIKEALLSTPNDEIYNIIDKKFTEIKLDKRIIKNIKKAISRTSRNEDGIIIINKKHRDEWFRESKGFKLQDGIQEILWKFLIQVEWHSTNPNHTPTNTTKAKSRDAITHQKQTPEKSEKEKIDEQRKNHLKKQLEGLQKMEEPNAKWYITLYQKIFRYEDSSIDNIDKLVEQLDEALKKRTDLSLRTAIESDLSKRLDAYPQPLNLEKLKWSDSYRISFCNKKWNLLLSWDYKITSLLSYEDFKKFQRNN